MISVPVKLGYIPTCAYGYFFTYKHISIAQIRGGIEEIP